MTQEEKAKAYDEAIERAKEVYDAYRFSMDMSNFNPTDIEYIFPQLADSEDERIINQLITLVNSTGEVLLIPTNKEELIAWLEKQKDASKAIEAVDRIDKYIDEHLANAHDMKDSNPDKKYYRGWDDALGKMAGILQDVYSGGKQKENPKSADSIPSNCVSDAKCEDKSPKHSDSDGTDIRDTPAYWKGWDDAMKQKEQKHPNGCFTCDEYKKGYEYGRSNGFTAGYNKAMKEVEQKEQKPAEWSEEDEKMRNLIVAIFEVNHPNGFFKANEFGTTDMRGVHTEEIISWLKSLRPQPKQKRQIKEGDKVSIHCRKGRKEDIITFYDGKVGEVIHVYNAKKHPWGHIIVRLDNGCNDGFYEDELEVLDEPSWKPSEVCYGAKGDPDPAGVWKPSKEQMEELYNAFYTHSVGAKSCDVLESLYNQLKKL